MCNATIALRTKWTANEVLLLNTVQTVSGTFSFLGSSFIICCFLAFPHLRKFAFRLVFALSLSDVFLCISAFLGNPVSCSAACTVQGFIMQWFNVSSVLWTTAISFVLFMCAIRGHRVEKIEAHENKLRLFCWLVPLFIATIPLMANSYEDTGGWCWISGRGAGGTAQRLFLFFFPVWTAIGFNCFVYYKVIRLVQLVTRFQMDEARPETYPTVGGAAGRTGGQSDRSKMLSAINRLRFYPLVLIGCWFFPTINRLQNFADPENPVVWLACVSVGLSSLNGFFNALVYGFTPGVRHALRKSLPILSLTLSLSPKVVHPYC